MQAHRVDGDHRSRRPKLLGDPIPQARSPHEVVVLPSVGGKELRHGSVGAAHDGVRPVLRTDVGEVAEELQEAGAVAVLVEEHGVDRGVLTGSRVGPPESRLVLDDGLAEVASGSESESRVAAVVLHVGRCHRVVLIDVVPADLRRRARVGGRRCVEAAWHGRDGEGTLPHPRHHVSGQALLEDVDTVAAQAVDAGVDLVEGHERAGARLKLRGNAAAGGPDRLHRDLAAGSGPQVHRRAHLEERLSVGRGTRRVGLVELSEGLDGAPEANPLQDGLG